MLTSRGWKLTISVTTQWIFLAYIATHMFPPNNGSYYWMLVKRGPSSLWSSSLTLVPLSPSRDITYTYYVQQLQCSTTSRNTESYIRQKRSLILLMVIFKSALYSVASLCHLFLFLLKLHWESYSLTSNHLASPYMGARGECIYLWL